MAQHQAAPSTQQQLPGKSGQEFSARTTPPSTNTSTEQPVAVLLKEKFPQEAQYALPSLRRKSPQGSCDLPTVFSGQLMTSPL